MEWRSVREDWIILWDEMPIPPDCQPVDAHISDDSPALGPELLPPEEE